MTRASHTAMQNRNILPRLQRKLTYSREKGTAAKTYTITAASANSNLYKKLAFVV